MRVNPNSVALFALAAALPLDAAYAQVAEAATANRADESVSGEGEILVTARRRAESLQEVPVAITALGGEGLERMGIRAPEDLRQAVPGLNISGSRRDEPAFYLRGQGPGVLNPGQRTFTSVATYFAEVPTQVSGAGVFFDLQNVQVLKGPQGTLFGRNTTGGAVLLEPNRPTFEFGGYVKASFGNYNYREGEAVLNLPVIQDKLAIRLAGNLARRDGFTQSIVTGQKLDGRHYDAWRVSILAAPVEGLENLLILDGREKNQSSTSNILRGANSAVALGQGLAPFLAEQQLIGPRKSQTPHLLFDRGTVFGVTNKTTLEITDNLSLKNIISFRRQRTDRASDYDGTPVNTFYIENIPGGNGWAVALDQFTEEFQVQGKVPSVGLNYILGFYHESAKPGIDQQIRQNVFGNLSVRRFNSDDKSTAVFAHAELALTDRLQLSGGVRYTWDDRKASISVFNAAGECTQQVPPGSGTITCPFATAAKYKAPTFDATLQYKFADRTLGYVAFRRGYKSGGHNLPSPAPEFDTYGKEEVDEYEVGLKSDWNVGVPLRTNVAVFLDKYRGIQNSEAVIIPGVGIIALVKNAPGATNQGVEFEASLSPLPGATLAGFASYLDSSADVTVPFSSMVAGRQTAYQPKWKWGVSASYSAELAGGTLNLSADYSYTGKQNTAELSTSPDLHTFNPGYGLVNMRVGLENIGGSNFDLAVFATNLTDKTYILGDMGLGSSIGFESAVYGEPRMVGISATYHFGAR